MKEEAIKALKQIGREDLIDSTYGYDIDDNIEIFMKIRKMIKYNNLQSQLKAKEEENKQLKADYGNLAQVERDFLKEIIKEARKYIKEHIRIDDEYPAYMEMLITERDELDEILSKGENKWKKN